MWWYGFSLDIARPVNLRATYGMYPLLQRDAAGFGIRLTGLVTEKVLSHSVYVGVLNVDMLSVDVLKLNVSILNVGMLNVCVLYVSRPLPPFLPIGFFRIWQ